MKHLKTFENYDAQAPLRNEVLILLEESLDSGWFGSNMDNSFECAKLENGWLDTLIEKYGEEVTEIKNLIQENTTSLWNDELTETFECVLIESANNKEGEEIEYNDWYEKLTDFLKSK